MLVLPGHDDQAIELVDNGEYRTVPVEEVYR
jgi:hypothetical protein